MSLDDDDDYVVPSGSRRSSYVPPSDETAEIPPMPRIEPEPQDAPSVGAASDERVAQEPSFADSVEIPVSAETAPPVVIEVEPEQMPGFVAETTRDQFGLPVSETPIDIPVVVISDPIPDALAGTGSVFDDNRLFPPAVPVDEHTAEPVAEEPIAAPEWTTPVEPEPIIEEPVAEEPVAVEPVYEEPVAFNVTLPDRKSLTPNELAGMLGADGGMSSNDQMALLDSQIPLREADLIAIAAFVADVTSSNAPNASELLAAAKDRFGDIAPELLSHHGEQAHDVVEHVEIVTVTESFDNGELVEVVETVETFDIPVESVAVETVQPVDDQEWSLPAPTSVIVEDDTPATGRRHVWTWLASAAVAVIAVMTGAVLLVGGGSPSASTAFVIAGVAAAIPFIELGRLRAAHDGVSIRRLVESATGVFAGRILGTIFAVTSLTAIVMVVLALTSGVGTQLTAVEAIGSITGALAGAGTLGVTIAAVVLLKGVIVAALPFRVSRAITLVLLGWTVVGTSVVVAMGAYLVVTGSAIDLPWLTVVTDRIGTVASLTLAVGLPAMLAVQSLTRIRDGKSGALWLYIGLGLGLLSIGGVVTAALLAPQSDHYFFGNNPVLHVIAGSGAISVALGAAVFLPAVVLVASLAVRGITSVFTADDRDQPSAWLRWALVVVPFALGAANILGYATALPDYVPTFAFLAIPAGVIAGLGGALLTTKRTVTRTGVRVGLAIVVFVTLLAAIGYAPGHGPLFGWVGIINAQLSPLGYGLMFIGAVVPFAAAVFTYVVSTVILLAGTRRTEIAA